jgi:hypothetical protein
MRSPNSFVPKSGHIQTDTSLGEVGLRFLSAIIEIADFFVQNLDNAKSSLFLAGKWASFGW